MENRIVCKEPPLPSLVEKLLPAELVADVRLKAYAAVEELRLKSGRRSWMMCGGCNVILDTILDRGQVEDVLMKACGGSLYAHAEQIKEGFLSLGGGIRIGVIGQAAVENGRVVSVREISTLCFRIPTDARVDVSPLVARLRGARMTGGLLLYSPPGGGKTTALRSLARALGSGESPLRVAVVDTRGELSVGLSGRGLCVDILPGYPRREGIEIAARSMGAQVIVCDEICGEDEARVIAEAGSGGVPLIASAHAADLHGLLGRSDIQKLHRAGVFLWYVKVDRFGATLFDAVAREEVENA